MSGEQEHDVKGGEKINFIGLVEQPLRNLYALVAGIEALSANAIEFQVNHLAQLAGNELENVWSQLNTECDPKETIQEVFERLNLPID
jgi:hypothetical protein